MTYDPHQVWRAEVPKCPLHPGVKWAGETACFVCYPTEEQLGTREYPDSWVPDPTESIRPALGWCVVQLSLDNELQCKRPASHRTILGFAICDECLAAVSI